MNPTTYYTGKASSMRASLGSRSKLHNASSALQSNLIIPGLFGSRIWRRVCITLSLLLLWLILVISIQVMLSPFSSSSYPVTELPAKEQNLRDLTKEQAKEQFMIKENQNPIEKQNHGYQYPTDDGKLPFVVRDHNETPHMFVIESNDWINEEVRRYRDTHGNSGNNKKDTSSKPSADRAGKGSSLNKCLRESDEYFELIAKGKITAPTAEQESLDERQRSVLVIGGASCVGLHLSRKLTQLGNRLVLVENFNPTTDDQVRRQRDDLIQTELNLSVLKFDSNQPLRLKEIFNNYGPFTHIVFAETDLIAAQRLDRDEFDRDSFSKLDPEVITIATNVGRGNVDIGYEEPWLPSLPGDGIALPVLRSNESDATTFQNNAKYTETELNKLLVPNDPGLSLYDELLRNSVEIVALTLQIALEKSTLINPPPHVTLFSSYSVYGNRAHQPYQSSNAMKVGENAFTNDIPTFDGAAAKGMEEMALAYRHEAFRVIERLSMEDMQSKKMDRGADSEKELDNEPILQKTRTIPPSPPPVAIIRVPNVIGPYMSLDGFIGRIFDMDGDLGNFASGANSDGNSGSSTKFEGSGEEYEWHEVVHVSDVVDATLAAMRKVKTCDIINFGSGDMYSVTDLRMIALDSYRNSDAINIRSLRRDSFIDNARALLRLNVRPLHASQPAIHSSLVWIKSYRAAETIEIKKRESLQRIDVVFTCYFTSKPDPQRRMRIVSNKYSYMSKWYESVIELGLHAVIFHDGLEEDFVQRYETSEVRFWKISSLAGHTTNDARFFIYRDYLYEHPEIERVVMTDISDVVFQRNPFELIQRLGDVRMVVGCDIQMFPNMHSVHWLTSSLEACFPSSELKLGGDIHEILRRAHFYNAGVIGGHRILIKRLLERCCDQLDQTPPASNCNMAVVNYVIHRWFEPFVFTGFPFNSRFMRKQRNPRGVYVIHK